ncbi:TraR/DksA family transcriptional regulator [Alteromonas sp. a30]|uniref:TraR/DksA family transcriptional regulator n=1 Tax=Alteromonas sp. a30 TaxID=2730917 RepID=UPI00227F7B59|nr:TraR/DksA C4-type zinc finger protein [Alteromonas sp. a30]MCY7296971.1 TraR/DksA family transcriptional regulator [Alteromonas sp. a30]
MNTNQTREILLGKQKRLQRRVSMIDADFAQERDDDFEELAVESENDEVLSALQKEAVLELEQITKALHLLDCGKYGKCLDCGKPIEPDRLRVLPYTTLCKRCAT